MRTKNSIKNIVTQFISNVIVLLLLFIGQAIFIRTLGIEYTGLNGLFSNILTVLNLFELGIGSSITYNLYKYIKNNDKETIKSIMLFYKKSYNIISLLIFLFGLLLIPFLNFIVEVNVDINLYVIYILFLISTVATYFNNYKRNLLVASQKNYLVNIVSIIYSILVNGMQIIILLLTKNYYLYLIIKIVFIILENITINIFTNKLNPYLKEKNVKKLDKKIKDDIISRVKALIIHKAAGAVTYGTDNILISIFLGITTVGLYTNYNYIITAVKKLFLNLVAGLTPSVGDLLIENNKEKNYETYSRIRFLNFWLSTFTSTCILILTEPFIKLWIGEEFILNKTVLIVLVINYYEIMMRNSITIFKDAAGIWREDRFIPLIQIFVNLGSSIILVLLIGLPGIFLGTLICHLIQWFYSFPKFVYKRLFDKRITQYIKEIIFHLLVLLIIVITTYLVNLYSPNIIVSFVISIVIPNSILLLLFRNNNYFKFYLNLLKKKYKK